jgi:hypothetical protein
MPPLLFGWDRARLQAGGRIAWQRFCCSPIQALLPKRSGELRLALVEVEACIDRAGRGDVHRFPPDRARDQERGRRHERGASPICPNWADDSAKNGVVLPAFRSSCATILPA